MKDDARTPSKSTNRSRITYADLREPTPLIDPIPARRSPAWLRTLGYAGSSVVWIVIFIVGLGATVIALPAGLSGTLGDGGLQHAGMFARSDWPVTAVVIVIIAAPILGFATFFIVCASTGIMLSAVTLFARSLNPRYRDEQLSFTTRARRGESVGGPATYFTGVAMSLVPVRMTRGSKVITIIRFNGFIVNTNQIVLGIVWGLGYIWTVAWLTWPATGAAMIICATSSALYAVFFLWVAWRRRGKYADVMPERIAKTPYARSWPNVPKVSSSRTRSTPKPR